MKVQSRALSFLNLISINQVINKEDWHLPAIKLRNQVVQNDIYPVGPVLFTYKPIGELIQAEFTYYVPVNARVEIKDPAYKYIDALVIEDSYFVRLTDEDSEIEEAYKSIKGLALKNQVTLDHSFYHVCLDVYGDTWLDIYAPIIKVGEPKL